MLTEAAKFKKDWQKRQRKSLEAGVDCAYLYVHLEADSGKPFYIGMGETHTRPWNNKRTDKHKNRANKHGQITHVDAAPILTYDNALWWEVRWIKAFRDAGYDLVNLTDSGDGTKGYQHTPENIEKMSQIQQDRIESGDFVAPLNRPGVREAHLEATQSESFRETQRLRIKTEGNPMDRPGVKEKQLAATQSDKFRERQRQRILQGENPMLSEEGRKKHQEVISSPEYKALRLETAPRGESHYMSKNPEAGVIAGRRLQELLTPEKRVAHAKKGWEKRIKRYQYWGA